MPKALILHPFPHSPASYESTRMVWSEFLYLYIIAPVPSALCSDFAFRYLQCCVLCTLWSWIISGFSPHWHKRIYRILPVCLSWLQQVCDNSKFPAFLPRSSSLWTSNWSHLSKNCHSEFFHVLVLQCEYPTSAAGIVIIPGDAILNSTDFSWC